jgi:hypothetical protein
MNEKDRNFLVAIAFLCVLAVAQVVLLTLKLSGAVAITWWWTLAPVLVPVLVGVCYSLGRLPLVAIRKVWAR